jgi:hypothetical protein
MMPQPALRGDLDIPSPSGNNLSMDQNNPLPSLTQDELRVGAWAEVRRPLELQLAPRRATIISRIEI